jgi:uncharacterized protein YdeI (YjbR/CyaY-like superfamily)
MANTKRDVPIIAFKSQQAWNDWLASQAADSEGLWLKLAKIRFTPRRPSSRWSERNRTRGFN